MAKLRGLTWEEENAPTGKLADYCKDCGLMRFARQKVCPRCGGKGKTEVSPKGKNFRAEKNWISPTIMVNQRISFD